ncbi:MAG: hypothetical protein U0105_03190 [Candidatus Obscuribacterales bacterium]
MEGTKVRKNFWALFKRIFQRHNSVLDGLCEAVMKLDNPFDKALKTRFDLQADEVIDSATGRSGDVLKLAAIFVVDTLDLAWLGAQAVFETHAKPEHAVQIYDRLMALLPSVREAQLSDEEKKWLQPLTGDSSALDKWIEKHATHHKQEETR